MHERKVEIAKRVGGFIGLPGGFGTFEEVFSVGKYPFQVRLTFKLYLFRDI